MCKKKIGDAHVSITLTFLNWLHFVVPTSWNSMKPNFDGPKNIFTSSKFLFYVCSIIVCVKKKLVMLMFL